jgi:hypothetical protein
VRHSEKGGLWADKAQAALNAKRPGVGDSMIFKSFSAGAVLVLFANWSQAQLSPASFNPSTEAFRLDGGNVCGACLACGGFCALAGSK